MLPASTLFFPVVGSVDKGSGSVPPARATPAAATDGPEPDPADVHGNPEVGFDSDLDGAYSDSVKCDCLDRHDIAMIVGDPLAGHAANCPTRVGERQRLGRLRRWQDERG